MKVGEHDFEVEEPDLVVARIRGEIFTADAQVMGRTMKAQAGGGSVFVLSSPARGDVVMGAAARKRFIAEIGGVSRIVNAVVRAKFSLRVLGQLVATATRALARSGFDMAFFDDERSARAWLRDRGCVACGAPPGPLRNDP